MEINVCWLTLASVVAVFVTSRAMSIAQVDELDPNQMPGGDGKDLDERATWLDTRDLEENFVDMVELSLHQLASQGRINPMIVENNEQPNGVKEKRGRFQGFCFRKTNTGRFLPYVCWKQDKRRK